MAAACARAAAALRRARDPCRAGARPPEAAPVPCGFRMGGEFMNRNIIQALDEARLAKGLSLTEVARKIRPSDPFGRFANRVHTFMRTGKGDQDLILRLAGILEVPVETLEELAKKDHAEQIAAWEKWADEPIRPHLVLRYMPAVYGRIELPEGPKSEEEWIQAALVARGDMRLRCCLVVSRRVSIWLAADGSVECRSVTAPDVPNVPVMSIGGRKVVLRIEKPGS